MIWNEVVIQIWDDREENGSIYNIIFKQITAAKKPWYNTHVLLFSISGGFYQPLGSWFIQV